MNVEVSAKKIGVLPNDWEIKYLKDVTWFQEGPGLRRWQFTETGIKVINITNLVNGYLDLNKTDRHISLKEFEESYKHFGCDSNDIVVASSGNSYCKHAIVRQRDLPLVMNTSVIRFKPLEKTNYEFLNQFLKSALFKTQIDFLITGGAQPNFGPVHLNQVQIPFPKLNEQESIANILLILDQKIDILDSKISKTQELSRGLMDQLLTKGIGHSKYKESPLGQIPESWEYFKLDKVTDIKVGKDLMEQNFSQKRSEEYKFPVYSNTVSNLGLYGYYNIEEYSGDSVTVIGRGVGVGKAFPRKGSFGAIGRLIVLFPFSNLNAIYLSYTINFCVSFFSENSAIPQLTGAQIAKYLIAVPPLDEQNKIASILTTVDEKLNILLEKKAAYQKLKTGLMQQLLTGKIRVPLHETA